MPGLALVAVLFVFVAGMPASAYTPEQEQACTPDAMRLCGSYIPDVSRITACMIQKKSQLCRRVFRKAPAAARTPRKPVST